MHVLLSIRYLLLFVAHSTMQYRLQCNDGCARVGWVATYDIQDSVQPAMCGGGGVLSNMTATWFIALPVNPHIPLTIKQRERESSIVLLCSLSFII